MPLITVSHDSLPYIDRPPTASELSAATDLIAAEAALSAPEVPEAHPLLPAAPSENYSSIIQSEFSRIAAGHPAIPGIDLSRYEALSAPETPLPGPMSDDEAAVLRAQKAEYAMLLAKAYASSTYLSLRTTQLSRLDASGKDEWLAGNEALLSILTKLEKELAATKEAIDLVVVERKVAQEAVAGEMKLLEKNWREGVGKVLETEVAADRLRSRILEARRSGAA